MGLLISRLWRKKTTVQQLENLQFKIQAIEERGQWTEQQHKRVIGHMMAYSMGLYVLFGLLYYFVYSSRSQSWVHSVMYASPLIALPVMILMLRSTISWYYNRKLRSDRMKLSKMRDEKKKLLEEVMSRETYNVAKEILDKFGGVDQPKMRPFIPTTNVPGTPSTPPATPGQLRQRQLALQTSTPIASSTAITQNNSISLRGALKTEQLPRPLLGGQQRSALDKVVDYLLGDGPSTRFALICSECHGHNGMAMAEEFEYVSYYCAYCRKWNPSRKQKPIAPPLCTSPARPALSAPRADTASSASESEEELDKEKKSGPESEKTRTPSPISDENSSGDKKNSSGDKKND